MENQSAGVLLIEDDPLIAEFTQVNLGADGFRVRVTTSAEEALVVLAAEPWDVVVVDIMLPGMDGFEICRIIRRTERPLAVPPDVPLIVLTARATDADKLEGFQLGVDDYVTKPFNPLELTARIRAVLRRVRTREPGLPPSRSPLQIDTTQHVAYVHGNALQLTPKEFDLLYLLFQNRDRVFSREELLQLVWGYTFGNTRTVDEHVKRLRKKVEPGLGQELIMTVWGVGYKLHLTSSEDKESPGPK
jgi:DNA-binding response OmpR family regulator